MNLLKLIAALTIVAGSLAMVLGTGAFTAIDADRIGDVGVAGDDEALLGVSMEGGTVEPSDDKVTLTTVENRFGSEIESVEVTDIDEGPFNNVNTDSPDSLLAGESDEITATVAGEPGTGGWIEITIVASSSQGPSVELTREVFVEIEQAERGICTIENDHRIGEDSFFAENEEFNCHIGIDAEDPYEVGLDNTTVTGGFEFESEHPLQGFKLHDSEIGNDTAITVDNNVVDDGIEIKGGEIDGDLDITIKQNLNSDIEIDARITGDVNIIVEGNNKGNIEVNENKVSGETTIDAGRGGGRA